MRAVLCKDYGLPDSLVLEEVEPLKPGYGQVVVSVRACGVNFPDTLIIQGKYQFKPDLPFSPGSEVAGIIKAVGEGVEGFKIGDRVIAFTGWGGFAEEVVAPAGSLIPMPEQMDFTEASAFVMTYGTAYHALKDRAQLRAGETLLVLGAAGGIGLASVDVGKALGAKVIAAASTSEKLAVCKEYGADELINYTTEDLKQRVKELTAGNGVDVVIDPVGGSFSEPALRGVAWGGRYLVIGFTSGEIPRIPLNLPLLKVCGIIGVFFGSFIAREPAQNTANLSTLVSWYREGKIRPLVSATYPLERATDALNAVLKREVKGKVVLLPRGDD